MNGKTILIKMRNAIFSTLFILLMASTSIAATYYVDRNHSSASDSNSGSESSPWRTIQKGANVAVAGDTVYVKDGIYNEWVDVKNSGSRGNPITFKAFPGDRPIIDGKGVNVPSWYALFFSKDNDYITLDGFEVRNSDECLIRVRYGDGLIVRNCLVYNNSSADHKSGLFIDHSNLGLIENNEVYNTGWNAITAESCNNITFQNNYVHDNPAHNGINVFPKTTEVQKRYTGLKILNNILTGADHGIYLRFQENAEIIGNVIYKNYTSGIKYAIHPSENFYFDANTKIYNNTIVDNLDFAILNENANALLIKNNIFANNTKGTIVHKSGATFKHQTDYNLYSGTFKITTGSSSYSSLSSWESNSGDDSNSFQGSPYFKNSSNDDYSLTSSSEAIDKGANLLSEGVDQDLVGTPRPTGQGFDIGAFEFSDSQTGASPPSPPTNLRLNSL